MRLLVVAYDFPPTQSPRALRWFYLTRELSFLGHEVHVLTPDLGPCDVEFPPSPGSVVVHQVFPGPFAWLSGRRNRARAGRQAPNRTGSPGAESARLNWRGRLADVAKGLVGHVMFPDIRGEWAPSARKALDRLLEDVSPDVVITSHEPAVTLPLGMHAKRHGFKWVADLGDPICASYTAQHWRERAWKLEAEVASAADRLVVTNEATRRLLAARHGLEPTRCEVIPNGYDDRRPRATQTTGPLRFDDRWLELIYAGRLYGYRDPRPLLQAVAATSGVRLTMIVPDPPTGEGADAIFADAGDKLRVSGPLPHTQVLELLEWADVLVNFGDEGQPVRTPAKLFEYFGIRRPILHVHRDGADAAAELLRGVRRGWISGNDPQQLSARLAELVELKKEHRLHHELALEPLPGYGHTELGRLLEQVLGEVVAEKG